GLRCKANEGALELAHVGPDRLREKEDHLVGEIDPLELRLLSKDRDARLELWALDVCNESPREARDEPLLHSLELLGVLITRKDDLFVRLMKRVERVEELFLRLRLRGEKLNVVDEEQVDPLAVPGAELAHPVFLERLDELVDELLGRDINDPRLRP